MPKMMNYNRKILNKLKINYNLIDYISKQDGVSISDAPSIFVLRKFGLATIDFDIAI